MEIIKKFGLEANLFLFQLINFLIILFILKKFLFKPIQKMLDERKRKIEQSLKDAEDARLALSGAAEERKRIITAAKSDASAVTAAAKTSAESVKEKLTQDAKKRSEQIVEEAKRKAAQEFDNVSANLGRLSVNLAQMIIAKSLSGMLTEEERAKALSRAVEKMERDGYGKVSN